AGITCHRAPLVDLRRTAHPHRADVDAVQPDIGRVGGPGRTTPVVLPPRTGLARALRRSPGRTPGRGVCDHPHPRRPPPGAALPTRHHDRPYPLVTPRSDRLP